MHRFFVRLSGEPRSRSTLGSAGDSNTAGGYGKITGRDTDVDRTNSDEWPYKLNTELEDLVDDDPIDEIEIDRRVIDKKKPRRYALDNIQQLGYKTGAFVNGSTRGLTGIMSGMDPVDIIEAVIHELIKRKQHAGLKTVGLGAPNRMTMPVQSMLKTSPIITLGSDDGWSQPPVPKDSDPELEQPAYTLRDVMNNQDKRSVNNASIEMRRNQKRSKR